VSEALPISDSINSKARSTSYGRLQSTQNGFRQSAVQIMDDGAARSLMQIINILQIAHHRQRLLPRRLRQIGYPVTAELAVLLTYLGIQSSPEQLDNFRRINDRQELLSLGFPIQQMMRCST
jgi:hypothetical protein